MKLSSEKSYTFLIFSNVFCIISSEISGLSSSDVLKGGILTISLIFSRVLGFDLELLTLTCPVLISLYT